MAHFLRDQHVKNLSVTADNIAQISAVFAERANTLNANQDINNNQNNELYLTYIIRFDNKGYRVFSIDELLRYFHQAKEVERILFTVESGESLRSNRQVGTYLELRLDEKDPNTCLLSVTSDDKDWVDASFSAVQDVLAKCQNMNGWVRTAWTQFGVQIIGVMLGFVLSLWAALKISPMLTIENSFLITFLFLLLIFSNTWTYINHKALGLINITFPNMKFYRPSKERMHWMMQAVIGGVAAATALYILGITFSFLVDILGGFINKSA